MAEDWLEFLGEYDADYDEKLLVCVIHRVFVPCRHGKQGINCVYSDLDTDVEDVRRYQQGE